MAQTENNKTNVHTEPVIPEDQLEVDIVENENQDEEIVEIDM